MAIKFPFEYQLSPQNLSEGTRWLTLYLKNVGDEVLTSLDINLHSRDTYNLSVYGTGQYIPQLNLKEEVTLPFQVLANATNDVYITIDGLQGGEAFHWESPFLWVRIGDDVAELVSLFAVTEPYLKQNQAIRCEATVQGLAQSEKLRLELAASTPTGAFKELATIETRPLSKGDTDRYEVEVTMDERGPYTIYAYLYDGPKRIGRKIEHVYVT